MPSIARFLATLPDAERERIATWSESDQWAYIAARPVLTRTSQAAPVATIQEPPSIQQESDSTTSAVDCAPEQPDQLNLFESLDYSLGIGIYSGITQEAIRRKVASSARLYFVLQHYTRAHDGNAIGTVKEWQQRCEAIGLGDYWPQIRDGFKRDHGVFFDAMGRCQVDKRAKVYKLRSKEKVMQALGISRPGPRVILPNEAYTESLDHFCAFSYSAYFEGNTCTLYRKTLETKFGVSRQTLYRWERLAGVVVTPGETSARPPENEAERIEYSELMTGPVWKAVDHKNKTVTDVCQWANKYLPTRTRIAPTGRSIHLKKNIKRNLATPEFVGRSETGKGGNSRNDARLFEGAGVTEQQQITDAERKAAEYQSKRKQRTARVFGGVWRMPHYRHANPRGSVYRLAYSQNALLFDENNPQNVRNFVAGRYEN